MRFAPLFWLFLLAKTFIFALGFWALEPGIGFGEGRVKGVRFSEASVPSCRDWFVA